jgi:hypothetical protein
LINGFVLSIKGHIDDFVEGEKVETRKAEGSSLGSLTALNFRFNKLIIGRKAI